MRKLFGLLVVFLVVSMLAACQSAAPAQAPALTEKAAEQPAAETKAVTLKVTDSMVRETEIAMIEERFSDKEGRAITTLDEIVELALTRLVAKP